MNNEGKIDIIEETVELVRTALTPQMMLGMGAGSEADHREYTIWRGKFESRWQTAYLAAFGVSPEAIRILHLIGAEYGFYVENKKLYLDGSGDVRWSEDKPKVQEEARAEAVRLAQILPQKFRAGRGSHADVEALSAAVLASSDVEVRPKTIAFPETDIGGSVPTDDPGKVCDRCGLVLCSKECIELEEQWLNERRGPSPRKFV